MNHMKRIILYNNFQERKLEIKDDVPVGIRKVFLSIILMFKVRQLN